MTHAKLKIALGVAAGIFLAGGLAKVFLATDKTGENLPTGEIFKNAREKYASLASYGDEGKTVAVLNGMTITTAFTIKLARPNLYRIEWEQNSVSPVFSFATAKTQSVWSAGQGDFLEMGAGVQKQTSQEMALASATGISGGAAATIPGTFFKMNWGNQLGASEAGQKRQGDEKVGEEDCYVFTSDTNGQATTLWIGKRDFLIHQVRHVTSVEAMKTVLDQAAKLNPGAVLPPQIPTAVTSTETHTNIVLNPKFSSASFAR